jgi:two-component system, cell cycle response regulator DivK
VRVNDLKATGPPYPAILVAEDNPDSRDALRALLEAYGYRVVEAENGNEAIEKARATHPDLVLMDIMMPFKDGLEATRTLRSEEAFRSVPILALTAMAGSREMALAAGCDDYLQKPIDIPVLLQRIQTWLARRSPEG